MNMKKTMAAIAAGAVAVSAMATTVSAEDATTLWGNKTVTFNLVQTVEKVTGYEGTITATIAELDVATGDLVIGITDLTDEDVVTVSGNYLSDGNPIRPMVFTKNVKEPRYSPTGAGMMATGSTGTITIPVDTSSNSAGNGYSINSLGHGDEVYLNVLIEKKIKYSMTGVTTGDVNAYKDDEAVRKNMNSAVVVNATTGGITAGTPASSIEVTITNNSKTYTTDYNKTTITTPAATALPMAGTVTGFKEIKETTKYPYFTNSATPLGGDAGRVISGEATGKANSGNVLACVYKTGTSSSDAFENDQHIPAYYVTNIINDAINSYGNVTFTFNTYKEKVNDTSYTSFGKNWWELDKDDVSGLFDDTTYWLNNWEDMNLFSSALIVNSQLTFSLSDAQAMKWTREALTFDWDDVQASALNPNAYTNYVNSMVLRTGKAWYWESLVVTFEEGVAEDVTAGAGDEATDNVIDEDENDGIDLEDDDEDDDFQDDDEDDDFEDDDEDDGEDDEDDSDVDNAGDVESPKTGNPAVALAVIPVALAAAAVVAKKRG